MLPAQEKDSKDNQLNMPIWIWVFIWINIMAVFISFLLKVFKVL